MLLWPGWSFPPDALREVCATVGPGYADVVGGWSLGGLQALQTILSNPTRWKACILISSTTRFCGDETGWPGQPRAALRKLQRQLERDPEAALRGFHQLAAGPDTTPDAMAARVLVSLTLDPVQLAEGLRTLDQCDLREPAAHGARPVLLLHGVADRVIPIEAARQSAARLPHSQLVEHPTAGHDLPLTDPLWVAAHIRTFLDSCT
jgi:pimeloyl-[acyl-carrier protein] methyl ester esterase